MALQVNDEIQTNALYQAFRDRVEQVSFEKKAR